MLYFPKMYYITLVNALSVQKAGQNAPLGKHLRFIHKVGTSFTA
jgi:hypothetical protein